MPQRVFVDANVLYSKTALDNLHFLLEAHRDTLTTVSSVGVFEEVRRNLAAHNPRADEEFLARRDAHMRATMDEVVTDVPHGVPFTGRDPGDYHVHAAATASRADILLTFNRAGDFTTTPSNEGYQVMHPDTFFTAMAQAAPERMPAIVLPQARYWAAKSSGRPFDEVLRSAQCPRFAEEVRTVMMEHKIDVGPGANAPAPELGRSKRGRSPAEVLSMPRNAPARGHRVADPGPFRRPSPGRTQLER